MAGKTADEKQAERMIERRRYFAFLDKRIPELHAQGKPAPVTDAKGRITNRRVGDFPGRAARRQADVEWAGRERADD